VVGWGGFQDWLDGGVWQAIVLFSRASAAHNFGHIPGTAAFKQLITGKFQRHSGYGIQRGGAVVVSSWASTFVFRQFAAEFPVRAPIREGAASTVRPLGRDAARPRLHGVLSFCLSLDAVGSFHGVPR